MLSANLLWKNSEGHQCVWITTPQHNSSLVPASFPFHLRFLLSVCFLFIIAYPACAVFVLPPPSPFFPLTSSIFCSWSHLPLHGPFHSSGLFFLQFPSFFSASFDFLCISVYHQLRWTQEPGLPLLWTCSCETWLGVYIYFFSIVVVIILLNIIMERFENKQRIGGVLQWYRTVLGSIETVKESSPSIPSPPQPWPLSFIPL